MNWKPRGKDKGYWVLAKRSADKFASEWQPWRVECVIDCAVESPDLNKDIKIIPNDKQNNV